ncbi:MAG: polysaccharide deacetylase family protein, partial [Candidatus Desulfofervidus auxilii]|nr:polysaccharide deacetylase family protein [Candidatus Desulfofervidus auxilii]
MLIIFVLSPYANSAMLTFSFDDGHKSVYESAFPILSQYGFVGTANVISNRIGSWSKMNVNQLLEMQSAGWEICSHSKSHPHFNKIPQSYQDEVIFNEWQKVSGMNYTYQSLTNYQYDELPFVVENGIPLKKKWSISGVENTPGSFYFDDETKTLYIHTFNSDDPSNYEIRSDSVERELEMSKEELIALGFDVNNFIVPYSQWNEERALLAMQYYNSVGAGYHNGYLNDIPFGDDYRYWLARRAVTLDTTVDEVIQWI